VVILAVGKRCINQVKSSQYNRGVRKRERDGRLGCRSSARGARGSVDLRPVLEWRLGLGKQAAAAQRALSASARLWSLECATLNNDINTTTTTTDDLHSVRESHSPPPLHSPTLSLSLSLIFFTLLVFPPFMLLHTGCHRPLHLCPPISSLLHRALSTCRLFAAVGHPWCLLLRRRLSPSPTTLNFPDLFYHFCRCHYLLPASAFAPLPLAFVDPLLTRPAMANRPPIPSPPSLLSARLFY